MNNKIKLKLKKLTNELYKNGAMTDKISEIINEIEKESTK